MLNILFVGFDYTSKGGIASVIKTIIDYSKEKNDLNLFTLKTCYNKEKSMLYELIIFIKSIILFIPSIIKNKIDIVHIHSSANISFYRKSVFTLLAKLCHVKIVFHIHSSKFYYFFLTKNKVRSKFIYFVLSHADTIIVLNNDWLIKLKEKYPKLRIIKIYNPIIETTNKPIYKKVKGNCIKVLFLGFLVESKGVNDILKIAEKTKNYCIEYLIGGKGILKSEVINYSRENSKVKFLGWVDDNKKQELLRESDILILPSYKEGLPISILEAISFSLPVISTNISGIPEQVDEGKNGFLLNPGDIEGFSQRIIQILKMSLPEINSFREASFKKSQLFAVSKIYHQIFNLYVELMS